MAQIEDVVLSVPDISCEHCQATIDKTLGALAGVESVSTDIPSKTVHLRYDPAQLTMASIETELDEVGYTVAKSR